MPSTDVVILGAGQAGLSMSRCLAVLGIEHVLIERGGIGERWKTMTWDTLRLLTPNWMNGLPWQPYDGCDTHGFMEKSEVIGFLQRYASRFQAPVFCGTEIISVDRCGRNYEIITTRGQWRARAVVIATGYCDLPSFPPVAQALPSTISCLHSSDYRSPEKVTEGGVLVVGASASGVQIAQELRQSGRDVTLSVGRHTRLPRRWRGQDIFWWLTRLGKLKERSTEINDLKRAIEQPSLQLAGRPDYADVDLHSLQASGVDLVGRVRGIDRNLVQFEDDLRATVTSADAKLQRILREIDGFAQFEQNARRSIRSVDFSGRAARSSISLGTKATKTVIWATGFKRAYPWLRLPIVGSDGELIHSGGVTPAPGAYALGLRFQRKRDSNFIGGVGADAWEIAAHVAGFLGQNSKAAA